MSPPNVKNCSSPLSASSTAATIFVACTSRPTRVLAFAMAGSSYAIVDRRAVPAARLKRHPTTLVGGRPFYTRDRTDDAPYGLVWRSRFCVDRIAVGEI